MIKPLLKDGASLVSIIVRTKNEERWIGTCLRAINRQTYRNFEVVLVDNESNDQTVAKAVPFGVNVVRIDKFLPGKALNDGIRASSGQILVCLSGHCIPADETWLENLIRDLRDPEVAGVYGRQQPLSFSSDLDKRDLMLVFGLDKKIQVKDSFFHNANSAIRRETWERYPFDEQITNIEDRLWGRQVLSAGMKIVYEPEASVYHWHGIHQDMDRERASSVVRIMEQIERLDSTRYNGDVSDLSVVAIIPSRGEPRRLDGIPLITQTLRHALDARHIKEIFVATDNETTAEVARSTGVKALMRPPSLSEDYVDLADVLQFALETIEANGPLPDLVAVMEETHPFRPAGLLDSMIVKLVIEGMDSLVAARREPRRLWVSEYGKIRDLADGGFMPRQFKNTVAYISLFGLGCITHPAFIRDGSLLGANAGIFELDDPFCALEIRSLDALARSAPLLQAWQREAVSG
jgi:rhamnosyltransferase